MKWLLIAYLIAMLAMGGIAEAVGNEDVSSRDNKYISASSIMILMS